MGANAPAAASVKLIHEARPEENKTSTDKLRRLLDNIQHISQRERQLLDRRELDGDESQEVLDEINQLRAARGKPPMSPDDSELTRPD